MSKKLLEESTIRSFMKLANLQPLSEKFISEKYMSEEDKKEDDKKMEEGELEEEVQEEGEALEEEDLQKEGEALEEEVIEEDGEVTEEGKESEGRPASKREAPKGTSLTGKAKQGLDGAKSVKSPGKFKAVKPGTHHSDKPDSIETKGHSNAPKKNNAQFDIVSESLEEADEGPDMGGDEAGGMDAPESDMGSAGETGDHKEKMKGLIRDMLGKLSEMGAEYGLQMEVSDDGAGETASETEGPPEAEGPPEGDEKPVMEEKLEEMVEKLTKRVAARLVKETKKKR
jgi:hypothetical protein